MISTSKTYTMNIVYTKGEKNRKSTTSKTYEKYCIHGSINQIGNATF